MPTLGYWKLRGVGQQIRFLLEHVGETYDEKFYHPENMEEWLNEKFTLGLDFPNLPYYIDGDLKLTGSIAIMKHIARKHKLADSLSESEQCVLDMVENTVYDILWVGFVGVCYGKGDYETDRVEYVETYMPTKLKMLSDFLENKKFILGDKITFLDFYLYEVLYAHSLFAPEVFSKFQKLGEFLKTIENLPAISSYLKSDRYIPSPVLSKLAKWQGGESK